MDCSLPGFSVYGIFQARILEWVAIPFSRGTSRPRDGRRSPALQADPCSCRTLKHKWGSAPASGPLGAWGQRAGAPSLQLEGARWGRLGGWLCRAGHLQTLASCPWIPAGQQWGPLGTEVWVPGRGGRHRLRLGGPRAQPTFGERTMFPQALPHLCQRLWGTADVVLGLQGSQPPPGKGAQHSLGQGRGRASRRSRGLVAPGSLPRATQGLSWGMCPGLDELESCRQVESAG